ncbi:MAG: hypothetical protein ABSG94_12580 [Brevinematales bacterium]|jgi:hypothetical protein
MSDFSKEMKKMQSQIDDFGKDMGVGKENLILILLPENIEISKFNISYSDANLVFIKGINEELGKDVLIIRSINNLNIQILKRVDAERLSAK